MFWDEDFKVECNIWLGFRVVKIRDSGPLLKVEFKNSEFPEIPIWSLGFRVWKFRGGDPPLHLNFFQVEEAQIPGTLQSGVWGLGLGKFARVPL